MLTPRTHWLLGKQFIQRETQFPSQRGRLKLVLSARRAVRGPGVMHT